MSLIIQENEKKEQNIFYVLSARVVVQRVHCKTKEREIRPYILLNDQITKTVVVNKPIKETVDDKGFIIIGITEFLLRYIK